MDYRVTTNNTAEAAYPYIRSEKTYTEDGNFALTAKDARGNTVTRSTNARTGELNSVTDPTGQTVNYAYDDAKRVTGVQTAADGKTYKNAYTYEEDRIKTVSHNTTDDTATDVTYTFDYDDLGRKTTVKVGTQTLSTNVYENDRNGLLSEVQYGNGGKVKYTYDEFDRLTEVKCDDETVPRYEYKYGANGEVAEIVDHELNRTVETDYDQADRPCQMKLRDEATGEMLYKTGLTYNKLNQLEMFSEQAGDETYKTEFAYNRDNRVTGITYDGGTHKVNYAYDELGRVVSRVAECGADAGKLSIAYEYVDGGYGTNSTTLLVKKVTQNSVSFEYEYDSRGNIVSEKRGTLTTTYAYDALGQLIRVNDPHENATWIYNYDRGGNILSRAKYAYTTGEVGTAIETIPYVYGDSNWKDKLTSYDGQTITYDAIGNPLNDGTWAYTWLAGRQLKQMSAEDVSVSFKYDHNGMRVQKVVEQSWHPETTNYTYHGKILTHMTVDYTDFGEVAHQDELHFFYDAQNRPAKVKFNGTMYTYLHNLQGDVVGILDNTGVLVVEYKYDAWGEMLSRTGVLVDTLGKRNPFRYRGYIFDEETGLYYLNSRYYNPRKERFINGDCGVGIIGSLCSHAVFTYCFNAPVDQADYNGKRSETNTWINSIVESFVRNLINTICGREHASGEAGEFSITSVTKDITITSEDADSHNGAVSTGISAISFITGYVLTSAISGLKHISKVIESAAGGYVMDSVSGAIQDEIEGWFTVRAGTYTSIRCQYERNFKIFWFIPGLELHSYELRLYPDYCEVWYSYMYSGFGSQITIPQKVGEMTMSELQEALGS